MFIVALLVILLTSISTHVYVSGKHFDKNAFVSFIQSPLTSYMNLFNISTGTTYAPNFSLYHYSGGPTSFALGFGVNSSGVSITEGDRLMNITAFNNNGILYGITRHIFQRVC